VYPAAYHVNVHGLLARLIARLPWAAAGFSDGEQKAWKKDRSAFIARVDQRRAALKAAAAV
jgi:hypothetical protein